MTDQLYLADSSVDRFEATVERVLDDRVVLDRTHFYPEGGGQPADHGTLVTDDATLDVTDVQKTDTVYHHVAGEPPAEGTTVTGRLDWDRRYAHMRYHTAQHLLSAILVDEYDAPTAGNQLYADRARIDVESPHTSWPRERGDSTSDVEHDRFTETDLADLEARMNELVEAGLDVDWYTMDREAAEATLDPERTRIDLLPDSITELRIVEIGVAQSASDGSSGRSPRDGADGEPFDRTACAGTHVRSTDELGEFVTTGRESRGSDAERLRFVLEE